MGKKRKGKRKNQGNDRPDPSWKDIQKKNDLLEKYYKEQCVVPTDEWDTFMRYCRKDLPSTFRITRMRGHAKDLLRSLKDGYISKITPEDRNALKDDPDADNAAEEGADGLLLEPISWYPDELAWNSNLSRRFIRRSDVLRKLHRFLVEDSECGAITRQEAVSMIPPMLLDVQPHHLVLDMCAAPGSKTAQLIELMHKNDTTAMPTGAVLANDADHKRCYMLTHQAKRLNTPCVVITNHDASIYPKLSTKDQITGEQKLLLFDRVLCDVPCSGDGTLRKNPLLWHKWTPHLGVSLHRLQMRILVRGLELLNVGGRLVYSTCSFNPIENEAVVGSVLSRCEGSVALVDCSNEIPDLQRRPGLKNWKVFDRRGNEFIDFAAVQCSPTEGYKTSMFPPTPEDGDNLKLERCMRIYPHLQNTGGFFIAVLEKKDELPWQKAKRNRINKKLLPWEEESKTAEKEEPDQATTLTKEEDDNSVSPQGDESKKDIPSTVEVSSEPDDEDSTSKPENKSVEHPKKFRRGMVREDPYFFLDDTDEDIQNVRKTYDLSNELPSNLFLVRSTGFKKRHVYLISETVHKVMRDNIDYLKIINTGVRIITRSPFRAGAVGNDSEYRLVQDGLHLVQPYIGKRIVDISNDDLVTILNSGEVEMDKMSDEIKERLAAMKMGNIVWHYQAANQTKKSPLTSDIWLCGHVGKKIVQSMLSKEERKHFLRLLGAPIPEEMEFKAKGPSWGDSPLPKKPKTDEEEGKELPNEP